MPKPGDRQILREDTTPVESTPWVKTLDRALTITTAAGVVLVLVSATMVPTMGARRSARLKWEERQRTIESEIARGGDAQIAE
jgi:hypothetical protein